MVGERVNWIKWLPRDQLLSVYRDHEVLLFPSLHDSGGWVVLEALANGVPVVCLGIGGPAALVDESCGRVVGVNQRSTTEVKAEIARNLRELAGDLRLRAQLSAGAIERAKQCTWERTVSGLYGEINRRMALRVGGDRDS
jgi:glycosyltransferase involved in cell wall biosynthesis